MEKKWRVKNSEIILNSPFYKIQKDLCITPAGEKEYFFKKGKGAVVIFAITQDQQVILEQQYRHPIQQICFDFPAGAIEPNETPAEAAKRELLEETGHEANELIDLGWAYCSPGNTEEKIYAFLAPGVQPKGSVKNPDIFEDITVEFIPLSMVKNEVGKRINCALCITTTFFALRYLEQN